MNLVTAPAEPTKCRTCHKYQQHGQQWASTIHGIYCSPECHDIGWKEYQYAHEVLRKKGYLK